MSTELDSARSIAKSLESQLRSANDLVEEASVENSKLRAELERVKSVITDGPKTLQAKYLDPACWEGCQGLVHKHELDRVKAELERVKRACAEIFEELVFWSGKKHEGDCEFSDKSDEGCWLCSKAERERWPTTSARLERYGKHD